MQTVTLRMVHAAHWIQEYSFLFTILKPILNVTVNDTPTSLSRRTVKKIRPKIHHIKDVDNIASALTVNEKRATGGYIQNSSGSASFTHYSGCGSPACGKSASGFTAAVSQLAFGSAPGSGAGDACGRCFAVTANQDPYSPSYAGPFKTIVVKVTDLCPLQGNQEWCGQTQSNPTNQHGASVHFDICEDTGGANAFFPSGHGALTGTFTEVSCSQWSGSDGGALWNGACLSGETAPNWPSTSCGNKGTAP